MNKKIGEHDLETASAITKKDNILDRLNKRNKDRQNDLDIKIEQRNRDNVKLEGSDYFAQTFAERVREIETQIENISETPESNENVDLSKCFAEIILEIQELQRYLTSSTIFLTDFKIKACQNILNELTISCEDKRVKMLPKKKFGFSSKKLTAKTIVNPKVKVGSAKLDGNGLNTTTKTSFTWTLSNSKDKYLYLHDEDVNGKDVTISNLDNCFVELQGHAGSVQISNCRNCTFLCGPIARSLFAENCENCKLAVACQQLRLHSSNMCDIYLHVTCRAIIEDCKQINVSPYNYKYPMIESDFEKTGLNMSHNNYTDVADFNWLSPDVPSPNWKLVDLFEKFDWQEMRKNFEASL